MEVQHLVHRISTASWKGTQDSASFFKFIVIDAVMQLHLGWGPKPSERNKTERKNATEKKENNSY